MAGRGINRAMASPRERPPGEGELLEGAGAAPKAVKLRRRAERVVAWVHRRASPNNYNQKDGRRTIRKGGRGWGIVVVDGRSGPEMQGQILYFLKIVP